MQLEVLMGLEEKALHYCKAGCDEFILVLSYPKVTQVLRLLFQKSRKLKDEYRGSLWRRGVWPV
jgi:hypothetical protein